MGWRILMAVDSEFARLVDALPALIWTALPDGNVEFVNQRWYEYTGVRRENACGWGWQTAICPEDLPSLLERWQAILASGEPSEFETRLRRFDGEYRWFHISTSVVRDTAGRIVRWCGVNTDVEDRRRAEDALRARERFRLIVDGLPAVVTLMTPEGELADANREMLEYFGASLEELKRRPTTYSFHPDDRPSVDARWKESVETGRPYDFEERLRRADGTYRWFHTRGFPLRDADGRIVLWHLLQTDVEDRKRAEDALRASELNLRQLTETIPGMLWSATADGNIDYCNTRVLKYTGLSAEAIMGDGWHRTIHPDDAARVGPVWMSCIATGAPYSVEVRAFHATDGTYRWCAVSALPLLDERGRILRWHGTIVDMHDWRQAQEQLRNTQARLAHATRVMMMGELTASIAHELNQPLAGIITNAHTSLRMLAANPPDIDGACETAQRTIRDGNRASEVIRRLRTLFARKESIPQAVDLNDATREVIALSSFELQRHHIILRTELANGLPPVTGDRVQLQQVVFNLIINASEAMSGVEDRPRQLVIRTELDDSDHVRVSVQDTGIGFDPHGPDGVFEAFYTTKRAGVGIGLSVSRSIVENHRGRLWAASNKGPGATFSFSIPRRREA